MKNLFYRNWVVLLAVEAIFFGFPLIELLQTEKRLGHIVVDSWSILSPVGRFCAVMFLIVFVYMILGVLIRDPKQKRK